MTAETDIAALQDGGANTAAEVRTALTSVRNVNSTWTPELWTNTATQFTSFTTAVAIASQANHPGLVIVHGYLDITGTGSIETIRGLPAPPTGFQYAGQSATIHQVGLVRFHDSGSSFNEYHLNLDPNDHIYFSATGGTGSRVLNVANADDLAFTAFLPTEAV